MCDFLAGADFLAYNKKCTYISGACGAWPPRQLECVVHIENHLPSHVLTDFHTLEFSDVFCDFLGKEEVEFGDGQPGPEDSLGF